MTIDPTEKFDPDLLLEASRVMNAAGPDYIKATRLISDWALKNLDSALPETRAAILGDAAALRLRTPGNYEDALDQLKLIDTPDCPDLMGRLHFLRALANGQKYKALRQKNQTSEKPEDQTPEMALLQLRQSIREDLTVAFSRDNTAQRDNARYWDPLAQQTSGAGTPAAEDDLFQVYQDDAMFRNLVATPAPRGSAAPAAPVASAAGAEAATRIGDTIKGRD